MAYTLVYVIIFLYLCSRKGVGLIETHLTRQNNKKIYVYEIYCFEF